MRGGATKIDVVDGHGSGNPDPDLLLDKMDKHAQMVSRDRPFDPYIDMQEAGTSTTPWYWSGCMASPGAADSWLTRTPAAWSSG